MEENLKVLAHTIVDYSLTVKKNDRVLISYDGIAANDLVEEIVKEVVAHQGIPFVRYVDSVISALLSETNTPERIEEVRDQLAYDVEHFECFVTVRYHSNDYETAKIPKENTRLLGERLKDLQSIRTNERRWVLLNYPSVLDAYKAKMKYEDFKSYAFDVMTVNYAEFNGRIEPLKRLMEQTDKVRLTGENTDITFSIKDIAAIPCTGKCNIPDGEIYTAPVRDSINGVITYNTPSPYQGNVFHHVSLTFENGKIIKAVCDGDNEKLNEIFDADEGSRYVGEFAIGFNPKVWDPMGDILFDEKIIGSIHFTPGRCYADANNGNESSIHWDMVLIQRPEYGGGSIYFDDVLVRDNGEFVLEELLPLNAKK